MAQRQIPAGRKVAILLQAAKGNTAKQVGELAGAGPTTVKQVQKLKAEDPAKF